MNGARRRGAPALLSLLGLLAATLLACAPPPPATTAARDVSLFEHPWHWTDEHGADVTFATWRGSSPLVLTTFFTSCTTRCPMTVDKLVSLDAALRRKGITSPFVLVTLDPMTDDAPRLQRFKAERHLPDTWHFLRGSLEDTRALARLLGDRAMYDDGHIDHDVHIALFDGAGRLVQDFAGWDFDVDRVAVTPAPEAPPAGLFASLRRLVERSGVRSIDELLPLLPETFRARHVLVFQSRSVQGASPTSPRVLLYTRDARFVATYNGDPGDPGYRSLETMEYDESRRAFRFREVEFPDAGSGGAVTFSEPNPARCLACHGEDPRPIWDTYPSWPGVFGGQDEAKDPAQARALAAFLRQRASTARYRSLVDVDDAPHPTSEAAAAYEGKGDRLSPSAEFGWLLQSLAYHTIARAVAAAPSFVRYRYALLAALDPQCLDLDAFVPEAVRAGFGQPLRAFEHETAEANAAQDAAKAERARGAGEPATSPDAASVPRESLTAFRYLVEEGLGVRTQDWTLALEKSTYDFTSPRRPTRVLERDLLDAVAPADPELGALHGSPDHRDGYCAALRRHSLAELGGGH